MEKRLENGKVIRLVQGDITRIPADAIANAANSALVGGGGVDGAIHRAGGKSIMAELDEIRREVKSCPTGSAVATGAGDLPARYVFHAVGPVYKDGKHGEAALLASAYKTCLRLATERGVASITFPSISTGVYGYPLDEAAPVALGTVKKVLETAESSVTEVSFVLFDEMTFQAYSRALATLDEAGG